MTDQIAEVPSAASVALAIPDPTLVPTIQNIPVGWAVGTFSHAADVATWEELDEAEDRIKGWDSFINSFQGDLLELRKAWRIVEFRRGVLLGTDVTPGQRTDLSACGKVPDISPTSAARCRKFARYQEVFWRHIQEATDPHQVSQRAVEQVIDEYRKAEVGPEQTSRRGDVSAAGGAESPTGGKADAAELPGVGKFDAEEASTPEEDPLAFDLTDALEDAQKRILALQAERDSLKASDKDAEIAKLHERIVRLEGYQTREQNKALERERIIKAHRRTLQEAADLLGVSSFGEIVPAIRDLLR